MSIERIEDVSEFVLDGTHASPIRTETGVPVLSAQNVKDGVLGFETDRFTSDEEYRSFKSRLALREGDLLLTIVGTIGRAAVVTDVRPLVFQRSVAVIRPKAGVVDPRFFYHTSRTQRFQAQLMSSANQSSQAGVYLGKLKKIEIPLPPLAEQRRIAEMLDGAEALRSKRRAALNQLDALTQSIFLDLFGDPKSNEKRWPLCRIGSVISDLRGGANLAPDDFVETGFPILHKGAIKPNGMVALDAKKKTFATPEYATANRRNQIDRRYLAVTLRDLVPTGPSIGLIANLQDGPFDGYLLAQGAYGFRVDSSKVTPEYLVFLSNMPSFRHVLRKYSVGSTQIHIRTPVYLDIQIPIPPLSAQQEFTRRVAAVKRLGETQRSTLEKLNALFSSLQTRAFIGRL